LTERGILGTWPPLTDDHNDDDEGDEEENGKKSRTKKLPPLPDSHLRVWMPASMVCLAQPWLVVEYESIQQEKVEKKNKKGKGRASSKLKPMADDKDTGTLDSPAIPKTKALVLDKVKGTKKDRMKATGAEDDSNLKMFYPVHKGLNPSKGKTADHVKSNSGVTSSRTSSLLEKRHSVSTCSMLSVSDQHICDLIVSPQYCIQWHSPSHSEYDSLISPSPLKKAPCLLQPFPLLVELDLGFSSNQ